MSADKNRCPIARHARAFRFMTMGEEPPKADICWADRIRTCGMMAPKAIVLPLDDGPKTAT